MAATRLTDAKIRNTAAPTARGARVEMWDLSVPGLGLRIGYGGAKTFVLLTRVRGKPHRWTLGRYPALTLEEARDIAREAKVAAQRGVDWGEERRRKLEAEAEAAKRGDTKFAAVAEVFLSEYRTRAGAPPSPEVCRQIRNELIPRWGKLDITEIDAVHVEAAINEIAAQGGLARQGTQKAKAAPTMAVRTLATVKVFAKWCHKPKRLITAAQKSEILEIERPRGGNTRRDHVIAPEEIRWIWRASASETGLIGYIVRIALATLQRRSEVAGMRWDELNLEKGTWIIPSRRTKTKSGHLVPLSPLVIEILRQVPRTGNHVFMSGKAGDAPFRGIGKALQRLNERVGDLISESRPNDIEKVRPWRFHDLRRSGATHMRSLGVDRETVKKVLNHTRGDVTDIYDRYAMDPEKRAALLKWATEIEWIVGAAAGGAVNALAAE